MFLLKQTTIDLYIIDTCPSVIRQLTIRKPNFFSERLTIKDQKKERETNLTELKIDDPKRRH